MAVVFNLDDMTAKAAMPRNFRIDPYQVGGGGTIFPVIHHGDVKDWTYMVQPQSGGLALWRFPKIASDWKTPPTLTSANTSIDGGMNGFSEGVTFQMARSTSVRPIRRRRANRTSRRRATGRAACAST